MLRLLAVRSHGRSCGALRCAAADPIGQIPSGKSHRANQSRASALQSCVRGVRATRQRRDRDDGPQKLTFFGRAGDGSTKSGRSPAISSCPFGGSRCMSAQSTLWTAPLTLHCLDGKSPREYRAVRWRKRQRAATDSATEQSPEVGWSVEELECGACVAQRELREPEQREGIGRGDVTGAVVEGKTSKGPAPQGKGGSSSANRCLHRRVLVVNTRKRGEPQSRQQGATNLQGVMRSKPSRS